MRPSSSDVSFPSSLDMLFESFPKPVIKESPKRLFWFSIFMWVDLIWGHGFYFDTFVIGVVVPNWLFFVGFDWVTCMLGTTLFKLSFDICCLSHVAFLKSYCVHSNECVNVCRCFQVNLKSHSQLLNVYNKSKFRN